MHGAPENTEAVPRWSFIFTYIPNDVLFTGAPYHLTDGAGLAIRQVQSCPASQWRRPVLH